MYFLFFYFAFIRLLISLSFSLFVSECLYHCPAVSSYDSWYLHILLFFALVILSLWISVLVFGGYIVTHWICTSLDPCFSLYSLWMLLPVFGNIITDCPYIVSSLAVHFYPCFSLFVSLSAYITANSACICTSLYLCFHLTFCLWMCIPVSEYIIIYYWCIYIYIPLLIRVAVSLSLSLSF